jgi:hypothetical protein
MSDLEQGLIQFTQACLPTLFSGEYKVRVDQTVQEVQEKPFSTELAFTVAGPRFDLSPTDTYSVYPPINHHGEFGNTLPQIVFSRRTLPWERTLDGKNPDSNNPCPWMALLILGPSDFDGDEQALPKPETRKLEELLKPADKDSCLGPKLSELAPHDPKKDQLNTIDLPVALFKKVVPSQEDLPFLAHVRTVDVKDKETSSRQTEGSFSVMLANRMPESSTDGEVKNAAYLVSLEGLHELLPGGSMETDKVNIRLAVLAHWEFFCAPGNNFKILIRDLTTDLLRRPELSVESPSKAAGLVQDAFSYGYTSLNHHLRNGEKTVSWYRGPLVPLEYSKPDKFSALKSADAALRYDYRTGMLDASYAAAWQLGRLLALQNQQFAQALYRYRNQARVSTKSAMNGEKDLEKKAIDVVKSANKSKALIEEQSGGRDE